MLVIGYLVLKHTPFGRAVLATGGKRSAARYSGIRTDAIRISVLVISSLSASFAGILYSRQASRGSLVMGMMNNGLLLMGLSASDQMIARGVIIILAVSLSVRESYDN